MGNHKKKKRRQKKNAQRMRLLMGVMLGLVIILAGVMGFQYLSIKKEIVVEAGTVSSVEAELFGRWGTKPSYKKAPEGDFRIPGEYTCQVKQGLFAKQAIIKVVDTTAPVVNPQMISVAVGREFDPSKYAYLATDLSEVTVSCLSKIDTTILGIQKVELIYTDKYENRTTVELELCISPFKDEFSIQAGEPLPAVGQMVASDIDENLVSEIQEIDVMKVGDQQLGITYDGITYAILVHVIDTVAPEIACPQTQISYVGEGIIFSDLVTVTDNSNDECELQIEKGELDVNAVGDYTIKFVAKDSSGNTSEREMTISVIESTYSQEEIEALADRVLADLIRDDMSEEIKCRAIYEWMHEYVRYVNHSDKGDWRKAAYEGLKNREGDCYVFAMTAKVLLTRAGIKNMDIEKIPAESRHYWSLVDIGNGWLHFDTCPRRVWHDFCLITDAELMEYSNANKKSHNYDPSKYPKIN